VALLGVRGWSKPMGDLAELEDTINISKRKNIGQKERGLLLTLNAYLRTIVFVGGKPNSVVYA
jgi:hypothetical protein